MLQACADTRQERAYASSPQCRTGAPSCHPRSSHRRSTAGLVCTNDTFGKSVGIIWKSTYGVLRTSLPDANWNVQDLRCVSFCLGLFDHGRLSSEIGCDLRTYLENSESYVTMIPESSDTSRLFGYTGKPLGFVNHRLTS